MIEKNSKGMTASELLREADSSPCSMCHLVMTGDESCATTGCASWAYRLADRIDAELAQARELSLLQGAAIWAEDNGWPDFREGEGFGEWLARCTLKRPCFEDGEPVQIGDKLLACGHLGFVKSVAVDIFGENYTLLQHIGDDEVILQRPAPEVLGADGMEIKVGDTVYEGDGLKPLKVVRIFKDGDVEAVGDGGACSNLDASNYTHIPTDTQERIDEDAQKSSYAYWACVDESCDCCPAKIDGKNPHEYFDCINCLHAKTLDLLRRQRELDARKGGE